MHIRSLEIANAEYSVLKTKLDDLINKVIPEIENGLEKAGAPRIE